MCHNDRPAGGSICTASWLLSSPYYKLGPTDCGDRNEPDGHGSTLYSTVMTDGHMAVSTGCAERAASNGRKRKPAEECESDKTCFAARDGG